MYLVYEKNYLNYDVDCVEETDMKLWSTKENAIADMTARKNMYIEDEDNDFTFMEDESSDTCFVFADELDNDYRSGEFHICLVELVVNDPETSKEKSGMLLASEALKMTNESPRTEAVKKQIKSMENKIKDFAERGHRSCIADFYYYNKDFSGYNLEKEIKEYFTKNGFTFKYVTDDVCGGVLQSPYWIICW